MTVANVLPSRQAYRAAARQQPPSPKARHAGICTTITNFATAAPGCWCLGEVPAAAAVGSARRRQTEDPRRRGHGFGSHTRRAEPSRTPKRREQHQGFSLRQPRKGHCRKHTEPCLEKESFSPPCAQVQGQQPGFPSSPANQTAEERRSPAAGIPAPPSRPAAQAAAQPSLRGAGSPSPPARPVITS